MLVIGRAGLSYVGLTDLLQPAPAETFTILPAPRRRALAVALPREEVGAGDLEPRAVGTGLTALLGGWPTPGRSCCRSKTRSGSIRRPPGTPQMFRRLLGAWFARPSW